jgi:hypothetical protein
MRNNALGQFARGLVQGFLNEVLRPEGRPPAHTIHVRMPERRAHDNHDFQSLMTAYAQEIGLEAPTFRNQSAIFSVPVRGIPYVLILTAGSDIVIASACSHVEFGHGVPAELLQIVQRLNSEITTGCQFSLAEDESGASFAAKAKIERHALTEPLFQELVVELPARIAALDRLLVKYGYAS